MRQPDGWWSARSAETTARREGTCCVSMPIRARSCRRHRPLTLAMGCDRMLFRRVPIRSPVDGNSRTRQAWPSVRMPGSRSDIYPRSIQGLLKQLAESLRGLLVCLRNEMGIHVERRCRIAMAETASNGTDIDPRCQQARRDIVPEIMKADTRHTRLVAEHPEVPRGRIGSPRHGTIDRSTENVRVSGDRRVRGCGVRLRSGFVLAERRHGA